MILKLCFALCLIHYLKAQNLTGCTNLTENENCSLINQVITVTSNINIFNFKNILIQNTTISCSIEALYINCSIVLNGTNSLIIKNSSLSFQSIEVGNFTSAQIIDSTLNTNSSVKINQDYSCASKPESSETGIG